MEKARMHPKGLREVVRPVRIRLRAKIIVAAPVAGPDTIEEIGKLVDDTVVLETPPSFQAVAEVYLNWYDVPDSEVIETMKRWYHEK